MDYCPQKRRKYQLWHREMDADIDVFDTNDIFACSSYFLV